MKTKHLITIAFLMLCTTFLSCSSDEDSVNEDGYSIIGSWKCTFDGPNDYTLLTFNVNGTGHIFELDDGEIDSDEDFRYSYSNSILTIINEDGERETVIINWKNRNMFVTSWLDDVDTWIRQ